MCVCVWCVCVFKASRAFGMLKEPVFRDRNLSITTKKVSVQLSCPGGSAVWIRNLDHHMQYNLETGVVPQLMPKRNLGHYI